MATHELKCWAGFFEPLAAGDKTCELRRDDRNFQVGDVLRLCEYDPGVSAYTGRELRRRITHIVRSGPWLSPGFVALSFADEHPLSEVHFDVLRVLQQEASLLGVSPDWRPAAVLLGKVLEAYRAKLEASKEHGICGRCGALCDSTCPLCREREVGTPRCDTPLVGGKRCERSYGHDDEHGVWDEPVTGTYRLVKLPAKVDP